MLGLPQTFTQAFEMIRDGGRMVAVGIAAGASTANVQITPLVRRGLRLMGSFGGRTGADLPAVIDLAASGVFSVSDTVTRSYPIGRVNDAFTALSHGEIQGRAVITMSA